MTLASSKGVTERVDRSLIPQMLWWLYDLFNFNDCGLFHSDKNIQLAFEFFHHVLADPNGEILELHEVDKISSLLVQSIPPRPNDTFMRAVCLELIILL